MTTLQEQLLNLKIQVIDHNNITHEDLRVKRLHLEENRVLVDEH